MMEVRDESLSPSASVESLRRSIEALVAERQRLRALAAGPAVLERNRHDLVRCQWRLTAALLAQH